MRLWTIQSNKAYEKLLKTGSLTCSREYITEESFIPAYDWLRRQMEKKIGPPPFPDAYPIWTWHTWEGRSGKPDMRRFRTERLSPGGCWRLTLNVPDDLVLLSDFDLWHFPLNGWYLSFSEADADKHTAASQAEKERSWQLIFRLDLPADDWVVSAEKSIQGTLWTITKDMVIRSEHFERMK